jgi:hypothetical protein
VGEAGEVNEVELSGGRGEPTRFCMRKSWEDEPFRRNDWGAPRDLSEMDGRESEVPLGPSRMQTEGGNGGSIR